MVELLTDMSSLWSILFFSPLGSILDQNCNKVTFSVISLSFFIGPYRLWWGGDVGGVGGGSSSTDHTFHRDP